MKVNAKDYGNLFKEFTDRRKGNDSLSLEILGGENNLSPLVLLRAYEEDITVDSMATLASQFCMNKTFVIYRDEVEIFRADYKGGDIGDCFTRAPYLLDPFLKLCYGVMIKKLTAPSPDSGSEEAQ